MKKVGTLPSGFDAMMSSSRLIGWALQGSSVMHSFRPRDRPVIRHLRTNGEKGVSGGVNPRKSGGGNWWRNLVT